MDFFAEAAAYPNSVKLKLMMHACVGDADFTLIQVKDVLSILCQH